MIEEPDDTIWVDRLTHKHECYPSEAHTVEIPAGREGRTIRVHMPIIRDKPERLEILETAESGDRLVLIGRHTLEDDDKDFWGVLMVGVRTGPDAYDVHVWHGLYPWALKHLKVAGLGDPKPED